MRASRAYHYHHGFPGAALFFGHPADGGRGWSVSRAAITRGRRRASAVADAAGRVCREPVILSVDDQSASDRITEHLAALSRDTRRCTWRSWDACRLVEGLVAPVRSLASRSSQPGSCMWGAHLTSSDTADAVAVSQSNKVGLDDVESSGPQAGHVLPQYPLRSKSGDDVGHAGPLPAWVWGGFRRRSQARWLTVEVVTYVGLVMARLLPHDGAMPTPSTVGRTVSAIPVGYRLAGVFMLGTAAGGMFFNLFSATIGYPGVMVVVVAGALVMLAGLVRAAPQSLLARGAVPFLLAVAPVPVTVTVLAAPADPLVAGPAGTAPATLIAVMLGLAAAHVCGTSHRSMLPRSAWVFVVPFLANVVLVVVVRLTFLTGWVLLATNAALLTAAGVWARRLWGWRLWTIQLGNVGMGLVAYATCLLFWGFHRLLPLFPLVLVTAMVLVALLSSRRVRREAHNLVAALLRDRST